MSNERDWDAEFAAITAHWSPREEAGPTLTNDRQDIREVPQQETTSEILSWISEARVDSPDSALPAVVAHDATMSDATIADEHPGDTFVPPAPAPLNWSDPSLVIMLAALIIGPIWLGVLLFENPDAPLLTWGAASGLTFLGFVLAVARQPRSRADQPDDDGARV